MPLPEGTVSRIWLLVYADQRLEQLIRQLEKLVDVRSVREHRADHEVFVQAERFFR